MMTSNLVLSRSCVVAALILAGLGSASADPLPRQAKAGVQIQLDAYASDDGPQYNCASRPGTIELVVPPRGGRVSQGFERTVLGNKLDPNGGDGCLQAPKNAAALYYTARPDFSGTDKVVTSVRFDNGSEHEFTYIVTVDPGVERPAQALAPAPAPVARPRETYRPAPTERPAERPAEAADAGPTSASDFLSRAAREGRRTTQPSIITPGLPPAASAQEPVVPSAERITTAQPAPPKSASAQEPASAQESAPAAMAPPPAPPPQRVYEPRL